MGEFRRDIELRLIDDAGNPYWTQHPEGQSVDVGVLAMPKADPNVDVKLYVANEGESPLAVRVGTDVFIVGFPKGLAHQEIFPVWKRGTIATEPGLPFNDSLVFLVDTATREGMSGSPVYARSNGFAAEFEGGGGAVGPGVHTRFLGVYSGRYGAEDEFSVQLGRVWRRELIDEIISNGVPGAYELR
jgi:hypothetical protein